MKSLGIFFTVLVAVVTQALPQNTFNNINVVTNLNVGSSTASRALVTDASKNVVSSSTTSTEVGYLSGVTSGIQSQLSARLPLAGGTMSGPINMGSQKITSLSSGTASTDAITLGQIDERITVDQSRDNIVLNPASNFIVDTNAATREVTLLSASGAQPSRVGTSTHTTAGFIASGVVVARRTYYVTGSTGQVTYNAVAYNPGQTFVGVYGVKTFTATGDAGVKDNTTRQPDSAYVNGTAYVASILGGYDHLNNQIAGTIAGGGHNELRSAGNHTTIGGGSYNVITAGLYSGIFTGTQNQQGQDFGLIGGGWGNWITSANVSGADQSAIVVGQENQIQDAGWGFIGTGLNQRITNPNNTAGMHYNTLLNGTGSQIIGGTHNFGSGLNLTIQGDSSGYNSVWGANNNVGGTSAYNLVMGSSSTTTNSPRVISVGTINTVTGSTMVANLGDNSTVTSSSYAYNLGNNNTINGTTYSYLLGRQLSVADLASPSANADYAMAQGWQAVIRSYGQRVESNGNESTVNIQRSRYILKRRSAMTTGVDVQLRLDGSTEFPYVPTNSVWTVRSTITAAQSDGVKYGSWTLDFAVRDSGGTLSLLGSPSSVVVFDGHSTTWTITAGIRSDATYRGIVLNARGLTGETVTWGASLDAMELNGAW